MEEKSFITIFGEYNLPHKTPVGNRRVRGEKLGKVFCGERKVAEVDKADIYCTSEGHIRKDPSDNLAFILLPSLSARM